MQSRDPDWLRTRLLGIERPVTKVARRSFRTMLKQTLVRRHGEILLITGLPGTGKTHLDQQLLNDAGVLCQGTKRQRSTLWIPLEATADLRDISRQIAMQIGNVQTIRRLVEKSAKDISFEALEDIVKLGVVVMFFDEAHNLLMAEVNDKSKALAKWLKNLTNRGVSLVFSGVPEIARTLGQYPELEDRFYRRKPIQTGGLRADTPEQLKEALAFLDSVQAAYDVPSELAFSDRRIAVPLIGASRGDLRALMRMIEAAVIGLSERSGTALTADDFRAAAETVGEEWDEA